MPTVVNPYHSILDIDFSNTNPWSEDRRNIIIKAVLGIPGTKNVAMQVDIKPGTGARKNLLPLTGFTPDTIREYGVAFNELVLGKNTIFVIFQDEFAPTDSTGMTEFQCDVIMENRDAFTINRVFKFSNEYLVSGPLTIDPVNGLRLTTQAGLEEGLIVPVNAIQMDGRAKIKKITVNGDADKLGEAVSNRTAIYRVDRGDTILQKLPLSDLRTFKAIAKIQMIDN
jgi:hypothetical protein